MNIEEKIHLRTTQLIEEIRQLKDKLHRRNMQIKDLKAELEKYKSVIWEQNKKALNVTK